MSAISGDSDGAMSTLSSRWELEEGAMVWIHGDLRSIYTLTLSAFRR